MQSVDLTYYGMQGTGRNVTEARRDAGAKLQAAMEGSYEPELLESRGWVLVLWRDPHGWRHNTIAEGGTMRKDAFRCYSSGYRDRIDALSSALLHLAQMSWDGAEVLPPCLWEVQALSKFRGETGRRLIAEFRSWRGFQLAYKAATAAGLPETARHRWACENGSRFADDTKPLPTCPPAAAG